MSIAISVVDARCKCFDFRFGHRAYGVSGTKHVLCQCYACVAIQNSEPFHTINWLAPLRSVRIKIIKKKIRYWRWWVGVAVVVATLGVINLPVNTFYGIQMHRTFTRSNRMWCIVRCTLHHWIGLVIVWGQSVCTNDSIREMLLFRLASIGTCKWDDVCQSQEWHRAFGAVVIHLIETDTRNDKIDGDSSTNMDICKSSFCNSFVNCSWTSWT